MTNADPLKTRLESPIEEERVQAVRELAGLDADRAQPLLYQAMGDSAWRVRKEAAAAFLDRPQADQSAETIIGFLHAPDNAGLRNTAAEILVQLGAPVVARLLRESASPDQDVRKFVLDILGDIGNPAAVPVLLAALADPEPNVRVAAAESLGKLRAVEAVPLLLETLSGADWLLRFTILETLGKIGCPLPKEKLLPYQNDPLLRTALFACLGRTAGREGLSLLMAGLTDSSRKIREAAILALSGCLETCPEALHEALAPGPPGVLAALSELLQSDNCEIARTAVRLLPLLNDPCCAEALLQLAGREELEPDALEALIVLGRPAVTRLFAHWSGADLGTQIRLCYLAGETGCREAVDALTAALATDDSELCPAAAQALARLGEVGVIPVLTAMLGEGSAESSTAAKTALGILAVTDQRAVLAAVLPLLKQHEPKLRAAAVAILKDIDYEKSKVYLTLALKDEDPEVRRAAVGALGSRCGDEAFDALRLALTDEVPEVRQTAARVLGTVDDREALNMLILALQDEDLWVRAGVLRSIGHFGSRYAMELLKEATADPAELVRIAALETLAEVAPTEVLPYLLAALDHEDVDVVEVAFRRLIALGQRDYLEKAVARLACHPREKIRRHFARMLEPSATLSGRTSLPSRPIGNDDLASRRPEPAVNAGAR